MTIRESIKKYIENFEIIKESKEIYFGLKNGAGYMKKISLEDDDHHFLIGDYQGKFGFSSNIKFNFEFMIPENFYYADIWEQEETFRIIMLDIKRAFFKFHQLPLDFEEKENDN